MAKTQVKELIQHPDLTFTIDGSSYLKNVIVRKNTPKICTLVLKNDSEAPLTITTIEVNPTKELEFNPTIPVKIDPGENISWSLKIECSKDGVLYFPITFHTDDKKISKEEVVFHIHDEFFDVLHLVKPYKRKTRPVFRLSDVVDSGTRPHFPTSAMINVKLKQYKVPSAVNKILDVGLEKFVAADAVESQCLSHMRHLLGMRELRKESYTDLLELLIYLEEHQTVKNMRIYDQEDQVMTKSGAYIELQVPGLADRRPSLIVSDPVYVQSPEDSSLYQGFIYSVGESHVLLKFSENFTRRVFAENRKFHVSFGFNRFPIKVEQQAVELARCENITKFLFPEKIPKPFQQTTLDWFNKCIANNAEQQQAVCAILRKTMKPAPYLVFGPPGTGKTMTIVEAVKHIYKRTNQRVLICAPSNGAANELARRLVDLIPNSDLFRFIAPSFPHEEIPEEIRNFVNYRGFSHYQPSLDELITYRVVITTLVYAVRFVHPSVPANHFGFLFIDEAGQATESQTLIPIGVLSSWLSINGQIVLTGDPKQLGPVVFSDLAKHGRFDRSMLERLMETSQSYKKSCTNYNPSALTKLVKNYRSHPVIVNLPNTLFYEGELKCEGNDLINVAINWEKLPNPNFPMIFHSVVGVDQRESSSPSFFNIREIQIVMEYLDQLMGHKMGELTIKGEHIGIISPYRKQTEKIKLACDRKNYEDLLIGSIEQIQGKERLIIIVSTVRSKFELLQFDEKFHLGFVNNPKRFNVAMTRAKALLIVIGNPNILQFDKCWRSLIEYCKNNGAIVGEKFKFDEGMGDDLSADNEEKSA